MSAVESEPGRAVSRRGLLTATTVVAGATALGTAAANVPQAGASARQSAGLPGSSGVALRWLGNNAWELTFGATTLLIDPWLTRFRTGTYTAAGADPNTPLSVNPSVIDAYVAKADLILVCHGHFDHLADVPYLAAKTGAAVLGTESHHNLLRAFGTPGTQLTQVRGGEFLAYDGFTIRVFESLHSLVGTATTKAKTVPFAGTRPGAVPPRPRIIADLVEGGTLAYEITIGGRLSILVLSTANFIERELAGVRPDVLIAAVGGRSLPDYPGRLLRLLNHPTWVLPTHWDDFDLPLAEPARDFGGLGPFRDAVHAASPHSTFVQLEHNATFTP